MLFPTPDVATAGAPEHPQPAPGPFQPRVQPWLLHCFGEAVAGDRTERNHRFLEEALELVQSCGCTAAEAHQLVDYVYGRPVGEKVQEVGGVMVTLAALCLANGLDMHAAGEAELARVWTKVEQIRAKQAAKPKNSPLPGRVDLDCGCALALPPAPEVTAACAPGHSTSAAELRAQVEAARGSIARLRNQCYQTQEATRVAFARSRHPHEAALARLVERHRERAVELAIDAQKCPHARSGAHMDPDSVEATAEGLRLGWDINGDYAPATFTASWEALLSPQPCLA